MRTKSKLNLTCSFLLAALLTGCQSTEPAPDRASITQEVVAEATVLAVDASTRELVLERGDGARLALVAGPEVRNFAQIKKGQVVKATYRESLSARLLGPEEVTSDASIGMAAGRAEAGTSPAGAVGVGASMTVVIQSVDIDQNLVVFTDPMGQLHAVRAEREEGQRFIAGLELNDRVELVFGESLVLTVE